MRPILIQWGLIEDNCVRIGWGFGLAMCLVIGAVGFASGGSPELSVVRAGIALIGFVLLGWATGMLLSRFAHTSARPRPKPVLGTQVDRVVGDEIMWPETTPSAESAVGTTSAA